MNTFSWKIDLNYNGVACFLVLLVFPVILFCWSYSLNDASGPFWLGNNFDPSYAYLFNSLSLSEGLQVGHSDHPGATLQWLGAVILIIVNSIFGDNAIDQDVLARPEYYLTSIHLALVILLSSSVLYAGATAWKVSKKLGNALLFQIAPFLVVLPINSLYRVSPEPLLLSFSILLSSFALVHFYHLDGKKNEPVYSYGVISGLGVALKLTFLPLLFLPLIVLHGIRNRIKFITVFAIIFMLLVLNPFMGRMGFLQFLKNLIFREGYNKPIYQNLSFSEEYYYRFNSVISNLSTDLFLIIVIIAALIIISIPVWNSGKKLKFHIKPKESRFTYAILAVLFIQLLFTVSGPRSHVHYFLPAIGLLGLLSIIIVNIVEDKAISLRWENLYKRGFLLIIILLVLIQFIVVKREEITLRKTAKEWRQANDYVKLFKGISTPLITYYRASNQLFSLDFGNRFARNNFTGLLEEVYPGYYNIDIFNNKLYSGFGRDEVTIEDIMQGNGAVWVQGDRNNDIISIVIPVKHNNSSVNDGFVYKVNQLYSGKKEQIFSVTK